MREREIILESELDRVRGQLSHFKEALEACEKASGFVEGDTPLSQHISNIVKERDELRLLLRKSQ